MKSTTLLLALGFTLGIAAIETLKADTFGGGSNTFTIDFVTVGNVGNADDAGAGGGIYSSPYGGVNYSYRMGVYEISKQQINFATNLGLANVPSGVYTSDKPATGLTWNQAAAFVNWLNTSSGHQAAYNLTYNGGWTLNLWSSAQAWQQGGENLFRHKDAYYFLPSEDEWYKSAFHKNDGVTANYWDYATGSNSAPTPIGSTGGNATGTAVYSQGSNTPADVSNAGGLSPYGTMAQNGNVWEWIEGALDGTNNNPTETRMIRGGYAQNPNTYLTPNAGRLDFDATNVNYDVGFRVASIGGTASVPEPGQVASSLLLLVLGAAGVAIHRRRLKKRASKSTASL